MYDKITIYTNNIFKTLATNSRNINIVKNTSNRNHHFSTYDYNNNDQDIYLQTSNLSQNIANSGIFLNIFRLFLGCRITSCRLTHAKDNLFA